MKKLPKGFEGLDVEVYGPDRHICLSIDAENIPLCMEYCQKFHVDNVSVNWSRGFSGDNIEFLRDYPWLRSLAIVFPLRGSVDLEPLDRLEQLESLSLSEPVPMRLSAFPYLKSFSGTWHSNLELDDCPHLETLRLWNLKNKGGDLRTLPLFPGLKRLCLVDTRLPSLCGLERYQLLTSLEVSYFTVLESIAEVAQLPNLVELELDTCRKIRDHHVVRHLPRLRRFLMNACGSIESLSFLNDLPPLDYFAFVHTDVKDGDLTPLLRHKGAGFFRKRHYSHTPEEIDQIHAVNAGTRIKRWQWFVLVYTDVAVFGRGDEQPTVDPMVESLITSSGILDNPPFHKLNCEISVSDHGSATPKLKRLAYKGAELEAQVHISSEEFARLDADGKAYAVLTAVIACIEAAAIKYKLPMEKWVRARQILLEDLPRRSVNDSTQPQP